MSDIDLAVLDMFWNKPWMPLWALALPRDLCDELCDKGLLDYSEEGDAYCITVLGGESWELERNSDWNLYGTYCEFEEEDEIQYLRIEALRKDILWAIAKGIDGNIYTFDENTKEFWESNNLSCIEWRTFPKVFNLKVKITSGYNEGLRNFINFRLNKRWWNGVEDLMVGRHDFTPKKQLLGITPDHCKIGESLIRYKDMRRIVIFSDGSFSLDYAIEGQLTAFGKQKIERCDFLVDSSMKDQFMNSIYSQEIPVFNFAS